MPQCLGLPGKFTEPGIERPYRGNRRWWLFALSGAMTCGVLSLTLLSLAQRESLHDILSGRMPAARPAAAVDFAMEEPENAPAIVRLDSSE